VHTGRAGPWRPRLFRYSSDTRPGKKPDTRSPAPRLYWSMASPSVSSPKRTEIQIDAGSVVLKGFLEVPERAQGLVLFAHGSGSGRHSSRNQRVAAMLRQEGLGTLLFDLLTEAEERSEARTAHLRFDIDFLAGRLRLATAWALVYRALAGLPLGYFGASTGAAAALIAAAQEKGRVRAVVSRGGRPDLAGPALPQVAAPTLLIVGGDDREVLELNREAFDRLRTEKRLEIVPGASHLFEEPGTLETAATLAGSWFSSHLGPEPLHP
jgi:putative phosphoribosyl transferase